MRFIAWSLSYTKAFCGAVQLWRESDPTYRRGVCGVPRMGMGFVWLPRRYLRRTLQGRARLPQRKVPVRSRRAFAADVIVSQVDEVLSLLATDKSGCLAAVSEAMQAVARRWRELVDDLPAGDQDRIVLQSTLRLKVSYQLIVLGADDCQAGDCLYHSLT
jgi:hypothetical protein